MKAFCLNNTGITDRKANSIARREMARGFSKLSAVECVQLYYLSSETPSKTDYTKEDEINLCPIFIPGYSPEEPQRDYLRRIYKVLIVNRLLTAYFLYLLLFKIDSNDLVYIRGEQPGLAAYLASIIRDRNYVFEKHNFEFGSNKLKDFEYSRIFEKASLNVTVSKYTAENWIENGIDEDKTEVIPSGVNLEKFDTKKRDINLGETQNRFKVVYTGHLYERKGVDTLIEAAETLEDREFEFFLIGGLEKDIEKYKNQVEKKDISNINLLGYREHDEIPGYLQAADALVLPNKPNNKISRLHTSPIKLGEYLASGKPVLASDLPSIRQIVSEKECFFFEPGNAEDLANKLILIKSNSSETEKKSEYAKKLARNYSWVKRCEKICKALEG